MSDNKARTRIAIMRISARGTAVQQNLASGRAGFFKRPKATKATVKQWMHDQGRRAIEANVKLLKPQTVAACVARFDECTKDMAETGFERWMPAKAKYAGRPRGSR